MTTEEMLVSLVENVKNINSSSPVFPTSRYLISNTGVHHLLNVFGVEENEKFSI